MIVYLATDHAGFALKNHIYKFLTETFEYEVRDLGAHSFDSEDDYPEYISQAAQAVSENPGTKAIIFGGSGQGEAMLANRYSGVRATVFYGGSKDILMLSREHNDANVLSLGARFVSEKEAEESVSLWLGTDFSLQEKYTRRIAQAEDLTVSRY